MDSYDKHPLTEADDSMTVIGCLALALVSGLAALLWLAVR